MDKKTIQKRRIMSYFIDAAYNIIDRDGIEKVTIREVADIAGYNSATIYNYFDSLEHLIFYASLRYLKEYINDLNDYVKDCRNSLDRFIRIWECFIFHSMNRPKIYYNIFFGKYSNKLNHDIEQYYSIFPEEISKQNDDIKPMLLGQTIYDRNMTILKPCIKEGLVKSEDADKINEMIILMYQGMLTRLLNNQLDYSIEEASERILTYIKRILKSFDCDLK